MYSNDVAGGFEKKEKKRGWIKESLRSKLSGKMCMLFFSLSVLGFDNIGHGKYMVYF